MAEGIKQQKVGGEMWKLSWVFQERRWSGFTLCWCFNPCKKTQVCGNVWDVQHLPAFIPKMSSKLQVVTKNSVKGLERKS